ncbi:hypothetical protein V6R21_23490 [Limibacter armeniacum]|uniref:hypothetical protein n=1 Tax=Limibacter armeniacum TaxID=466084 RepID=UPI002FE5D4EB
MKNLVLLFGLLFASVVSYAQASILGKWDTGKENTTIEIKSVGSEFEGIIASSDNSQATAGKLIIKHVKRGGEMYKGKIYIIKKDRWVDVVLIPKDGILTINISAGWQKKTLNWKKIN